MREIEHAVRVVAWLHTKDATKQIPQNFPERLPLTAAERKSAQAAEAPVYESLPINEMADFLGWSRHIPAA